MDNSIIMSKEYRTEYYKNPTVFLLIFIILILLIMGISIYLGRVYNSDLLGLWLPILMLILPIILSNKIKNIFITKRVILYFDDMKFVVTLYLLNADQLISQKSFLWQDIIAYKFYFDTKSNTCLTLYLKDKTSADFIFKDNKTYEEAIEQDSVFSNFYSFVLRYNQKHEQQRIIPRPSLLATEIGKYIILIEVCLLVLAFMLHIMMRNFSHAYYLMIGVGLLIPQILNRKQNRNMYNKLMELDHG